MGLLKKHLTNDEQVVKPDQTHRNAKIGDPPIQTSHIQKHTAEHIPI